MEVKKAERLIWISSHLYFKDKENRLITDVLYYLIKIMRFSDDLHRYFFVRYVDLGYHVRFRFYIPECQAAKWKGLLEEQFSKFIHAQQLDETDAQNTIGVHYKVYEPEILRYGGPDAMPIAERQFEASSDFALQELRHVGNSSLLSIAIKMNIILLHGMNFNLEQMAAIYLDFVEEWLPSLYDNTTTKQSTQKDYYLSIFSARARDLERSLTKAVRRTINSLVIGNSKEHEKFYHTIACETANLYKLNNIDLYYRSDIVRSFMHMNHNRLGVQNMDEPYVAYLMYRTLLNLEPNG